MSPFPGMNPYLESPTLWAGFHHLLASELTAQLNATLVERYYADVEVQAALEEISIALRTVQIRTLSADELVTSIEILSPINKRGKGAEAYRRKRHRLLRTEIHLVELDLLRGGQRSAWEAATPPLEADYLCTVNRAVYGKDRVSEIWPISLNEPLPTLPIPLLPPDADAHLDLGAVVQQVAKRAAYARRLTYQTPIPPPKLRPAMQRWWESVRANVD